MKIKTSYFYQIRNFTKNMIPVSTAIWDPRWYHNFTNDYSYVFKDKRGILNGIRLEAIIQKGRETVKCGSGCPCAEKDPSKCAFLRDYRKKIKEIDFNKMYKDMEIFAQRYKEQERIAEEIIFVLIVYETPWNPCSERLPLQELFNSHGIECKELDYPILTSV